MLELHPHISSMQHVGGISPHGAWVTWVHGLDSTHCDILLDSGKASYTLKVYVVAISAHHVLVNGSYLGSHTLVCSF